ncbi:ATP-binding protein [uncultured Aquimarina sp.]|uniref:AAA family ATPase n=1 Tax=uncultured Aquimarina sp. TaxID=575652 RepID=UPI002633F0F1|nr:ATP-binding protein [uncultured Aquimarina sp.]
MNISIEYSDLDSQDIPKELFHPKYKIDDKILIDDKGINVSNNIIPNLGIINFFIGANNSGKSRFIRGLFKLNDLNIFCLEKENIQLIKRLETIHALIIKLEEKFSFPEKEKQSFEKLLDKLDPSKDSFTNLLNLHSNQQFISEILEKFNSSFLSQIDDHFMVIEIQKINRELQDTKNELEFNKNTRPSKKTYIPVLRSPNSNPALKSETYLETLSDNYGVKNDVFTGLEIYSEIKKLQGARANEKKKKKEFEKFLSKHFFNNNSVEITASNDDKTLLFNIGEDEEHELFHIGDGIQSLILILFPIFMSKEKEWLLIEEPETHLHPGYQRIFLDTILNNEYIKNKNLRLFFTTHSNHFLDQSLTNDDVSIFQFKKENEEMIDVKTNVKPSKETLDLLGVTSSSVLIANSSVWVEGPTDRKYVSKWLSVFPKLGLKEDIDYAFFEYGGDLIAHYLFDKEFEDSEEMVREKIKSFALSNHIYLLADNDNPKEGSAKDIRRSELEKLSKESDNFSYQNTKVKEIENLLPPQILKDFLPELVTGEYADKIKSIDFESNAYENIGLGKFFYTILTEAKIPKKDLKPFYVESGTLKSTYKSKLCNFVVQGDYSYDNFIEENDILKDIIENLYDFIKPRS